MEHNQYAVYSVKINGTKRTGYHENHQDWVNTGEVDNSEIIQVVAPSDEELANLLMGYSLKKESWSEEKFSFEIVDKKVLKYILRFEDAYRARF